MTLLQELRVSRGDPASEGDSTADFSTFERSIRNERRTIDRSRAEGGIGPSIEFYFFREDGSFGALSYILISIEQVFRFCPFPGTGY